MSSITSREEISPSTTLRRYSIQKNIPTPHASGLQMLTLEIELALHLPLKPEILDGLASYLSNIVCGMESMLLEAPSGDVGSIKINVKKAFLP